MAYILSPNVVVQEYEIAGIVPGVSTTEAGLAGQFNWGPVNVPTLLTSEGDQYKTFRGPDNVNASDWFTGANFLSYATALWTVRVVVEGNANTSLNATNATSANSSGFLVRNDTQYLASYADGSLKTSFGTGEWIAKFPGSLGNSLKVSVCPSAAAYQSNLTGTITASANSLTVSGSGTTFTTQVSVGDLLVFNSEVHKVASVANTTSLTLSDRTIAAASGASAQRRWQFYNSVQTAPGTSTYASVVGASNDEMHIVVVDEDGLWTGQTNSVLEVYQYVSKASDGKLPDGTTNHYVNRINQTSKFIRWAGDSNLITSISTPSTNGTSGTAYGAYAKPLNSSLIGGKNGGAIGNSEKLRGYGYFQAKEDIDISFVLGSAGTQTVATYLINNIAEVRKDCLAFISPPRAFVVNNVGSEATACVEYRNTLPSTSFAVLDSNWKYQYDKYNDVYRFVPMNGDIAGLHSQSDQARDPWYAAAGFNRGQIKNAIKLAWNPKLAERDLLYNNGINPVVTFPGDGTVLFGQKTLLAKPSAFDRINVRRLFIVLEKAISKAAKYFLFEFNDPITRAQFKNMVEPFLRDVQGRRGIYAFSVVCDTSNNTDEVLARNEFVGDIFIKPAKTAEFIRLNFVAVRDSVEFNRNNFVL